ncbi:MAG: AGE family epimerase/isomerase [Paramuribaculum sp.]|nr:AGE family epimerase/isomerase [Paramuribaculum sp.]
MISEELKNSFAKELSDNLNNNILPYWLDNMTDPAGGYYGRRDGYDTLHPEAQRGAILNARILWTFSAAYISTGRQDCLDAATRAKDYILAHFIDKTNGGVYWSLDADGSVADSKKQFYAIAFTVYGLAEYNRATGDEEALSTAIALFRAIETHSRDRAKGGYREAATADWQPIEDMRLSDKDANFSKTMNTHLHILEAYTALLRVWRTEESVEATKYALEIILDRITDAKTGHLGLFFDDEWVRQDAEQSFGHDIEASWLMLEAAEVIGKPELYTRTLAATRRMADAALEGLCADGSMVYERHGNGAYDNEKHWWVQAEAVVGQAYLARYHGVAKGWDGAWKTWGYIRNYLVDVNEGEWYWSRLADGSVNRAEDKAGFWKCPYHNGRMCMETLRLLSAEAL